MTKTLTPDHRPLKVLIVGAGIGGLTTAIALRRQGHDVELFEASRFSNEAGAAIHVVPNANSVLQRLGVDVKESGAVLLKRMRLIKHTGEILNHQDMLQKARRWQSDWRQTLRAHLHEHLRTAAVSPQGVGIPAKLHNATRITGVDTERATLFFADGATVQGDVIIGADGVHSVARLSVDQHIRAVRGTHSAFRFLVTRKEALEDPRTADFYSMDGSMDSWYSENRKIITYPCADNKFLNFVCIHPANLSAASDGYNTRANKSLLQEIFKGFDPKILAMLDKADPGSLKVYPLFDMEALPTFVKGRLALVGDAAHPFLPHLAQGGAMAIEDGVALGVMLSNASAADVPSRLQLYNDARYIRATLIQKYTRIVGGDGIKDEESTTEKLSLNEYLEYGLSHDEYHASTDLLRRHQWAQQPSLDWRQPISFGPMPGPRQDFPVSSRCETLDQATCCTATIMFKTSATLLRNLLPSASYNFTSRDTVAYASLKLHALNNLQWLCGTGYNLLEIYIHNVQYTKASGEKVTGAYLPVMFEDLADPVLSARGELGYPRVYSEIKVEELGDCLTATMTWRGAVWGKFKWPALQEEPITPGMATPEENVIVHRYIPGLGSQSDMLPDSNYAALLPSEKIMQAEDIQGLAQARKTCGAPASIELNPLNWQQLPTLHHIVSRLAELPIFEVVDASIKNTRGVPDFTGIVKL